MPSGSPLKGALCSSLVPFAPSRPKCKISSIVLAVQGWVRGNAAVHDATKAVKSSLRHHPHGRWPTARAGGQVGGLVEEEKFRVTSRRHDSTLAAVERTILVPLHLSRPFDVELFCNTANTEAS